MNRDTISREEYLQQEKEIIEKSKRKEIDCAETNFRLQELRKKYPSWIFEIADSKEET